ncbi:response regulator transcription factor [Nonomuraea sp. NN258]|uniref:response regulator transcription factor n=1 Tax=Nonomuraea antri TaxID=2730852 RepID=UPI001568FA5E|nr:response regulator transcription factor [Nonomuraea antri]NRQ31856.1 response regulator transcription factor [Nonomuraea antri]
MRILVIDDVQAHEAGVARAVEKHGDHRVTGVRTPAELRLLLTQDSDFQLAFVDLHYGREVGESGLAALEALDQYEIPAVIYSADAEYNRTLYLLAAFEFFPQTCTLVSKHAGDEVVSRTVEAVRLGHNPAGAAALPYRPPRRGPSLLHRLIDKSDDLRIWRALARYSTLTLVAKEAAYSVKTISNFNDSRAPVIVEFEHKLRGRPLPDSGEVDSQRGTPLMEAHTFALRNEDFFSDPDAERLVRLNWDRHK